MWVVEGNRRARRFYEREGLRLDGATKQDTLADVRDVRYRAPLG